MTKAVFFLSSTQISETHLGGAKANPLPEAAENKRIVTIKQEEKATQAPCNFFYKRNTASCAALNNACEHPFDDHAFQKENNPHQRRVG